MKIRMAAVLTALLAAGPALAQDPTVAELQAEIQKLRQQNAKLEAQNKGLARQLAKPARAVRAKPVARQQQAAKLAAQARNIERDVARVQQALVRARARARAGVRVQRRPNPLVQGAYQKALADLQKGWQQLAAIEDIDAAIKSVDALSQVLLAARAALWHQKQAKKNAPK